MTDMTDWDPRFPGAHQALIASLGDNDVMLPRTITAAAVTRILARLDATTEDQK